MDLQGHLDALALKYQEFARETYLSYSTVRMVIDGRSVTKHAVDRILEILSRKYGRKVEREEVEGLLFFDET
jgi:predicted transcriptional regulator